MFELYVANENDSIPFYEIELPNDENNQNLVKVLKIFKINDTNIFDLTINCKFENDLNNNFSINAFEIFDVLSCIISQRCDKTDDRFNNNSIYVKYNESNIFSLCLYKQYFKSVLEKTRRLFKTICLDKSEYNKFINVIAYLLNIV